MKFQKEKWKKKDQILKEKNTVQPHPTRPLVKLLSLNEGGMNTALGEMHSIFFFLIPSFCLILIY